MFIDVPSTMDTASHAISQAPTWLQAVSVLSTVGLTVFASVKANDGRKRRRDDKRKRMVTTPAPKTRK